MVGRKWGQAFCEKGSTYHHQKVQKFQLYMLIYYTCIYNIYSTIVYTHFFPLYFQETKKNVHHFFFGNNVVFVSLKLDWRKVDKQQWVCCTFHVTQFIFFFWKTAREEFEDQLDFQDRECGNELWPELTATLWKNYRKQLQSSVSIKGRTDSVWPGIQWLQRSVRLPCFSRIHELTVQRTFP